MIPERREAILRALEGGPRSTMQLSRELGLPNTTVRRYARHLMEEGLLTRSFDRPSRGSVESVWRLL